MFDKKYPNRKDWRKPYVKSKAFDRSCRNHGSCEYCKSNRLFFDTKKRLAMEMDYVSDFQYGGKDWQE